MMVSLRRAAAIAALLGVAALAAYVVLWSDWLASEERALPDLENAIAFVDPASCAFAPQTDRIMNGLIRYEEATDTHHPGAPLAVPGLAKPLIPKLGPAGEGFLETGAEFRGRWHGLTVIGVRRLFVPNTGVSNLRPQFAEPATTSRPILNRLGFALPPVGEAREFGDGMTEYISVVADGGGSALSCAT